ncbi:recombination regulator RecX [Ectobacillus polymachus]|uniref:recombination regulator RecX n=1 Tax=Ectobacillus polymachus TaxID=1508806 RepID=UPI003A89E49F
MAVITKMQVQKASKERYNIYIDKGYGEEYGFSVDESTLAKHGLRKGMEIDELELADILYDEEVRQCYLKAIVFLSYQMRTKQEIEEHLSKKDYGVAVIQEAIHKLIQAGYVNDQEYAIAYVRTQYNVGSKGPIIIRRELMGKGIPQDVVISSLHEYTEDKQITNAIQLCEKKRKTLKNLSAFQLKKKLEEMLMRKGYPSSIIAIAMEEQEDQDADEEWTAALKQGSKLHDKYKKDRDTYKMKMKQSLYRKGFQLETIERVIQELSEE